MLKKGADLSNEKIAGKFEGYSEVWTKATFLVDSIKEWMRLTDEYVQPEMDPRMKQELDEFVAKRKSQLD